MLKFAPDHFYDRTEKKSETSNNYNHQIIKINEKLDK